MRKILILTATLLLSACGGDSSTGPEDGAALENGSMSARIDGAAWTATSALAVSYEGGILAFAGSDDTQTTVGIGLIPDGPGSYPMGPDQPTNADLTFGGGKSWGASPFLGSGSVTLTSMSEHRATGTFAFTADPVESTGAAGTKVVTEGTFDVNF